MNDGSKRNISRNKRNSNNKRRRRRKPSSYGSYGMPGMPVEKTDGRRNVPEPLRGDGSLDPFALFCALHLGIGPDDNYQPMGVPGVARRFGVEARRVRESLRAYALDNDSIRHIPFEMNMARLDTRVVPDGISRTEQARMHWDFFLEAARDLRDWESILNVPEPEEYEEEADSIDDEFESTGAEDFDESEGEAAEQRTEAPEPKPRTRPKASRPRTRAARGPRAERIAEPEPETTPKPEPETNTEPEQQVEAAPTGDDPPKPKRRRRTATKRKKTDNDEVIA